MRSTWLEAEESCQAVVFTSVSRVRPSHETIAKHSAWRIFMCEFLTFTHTIYTLITHKCKWDHSERKILDGFSTTHTPIFYREIYSSLVRNHCSLFSIPLPLSYLERRFVPNTQPTTIQSVESVLELGKHWGIAKRSRWGLADAIGWIAGSGELDKIRFWEALLE